MMSQGGHFTPTVFLKLSTDSISQEKVPENRLPSLSYLASTLHGGGRGDYKNKESPGTVLGWK